MSREARAPTAYRRLLLVVIAAGLVLRVGAVGVLGANQPTYEWGVMGANLAHGRGFSYFGDFPGAGVLKGVKTGVPQPSAWDPPVYVVVAAAANRIAGSVPQEIRLLQLFHLALFPLLALLMFALGTELLGRRVGLLAALGVAVYPPLIYEVTQVSAANLYLPVEVAMLLAAVRLLRAPDWKRAVLAGLLAGALCLMRAEAVFFLLLIAVVVLRAGRSAPDRRPIRRAVAVFLLVGALPVVGWLARNAATFGRPVPGITTQAGFVLWAGNHAGATGSGKTYTHGARDVAAEAALYQQAAALPPGRDYELRFDALFRKSATTWITQHPFGAIEGVAKKAFLLAVVDPDDHRSVNPVYLGGWALLVVLTVIAFRRHSFRGPEWRLLGAYALVSFAVPVVLVVLPRYRLPVDMVMLLPAALTVSEWAPVRGILDRIAPEESGPAPVRQPSELPSGA